MENTIQYIKERIIKVNNPTALAIITMIENHTMKLNSHLDKNEKPEKFLDFFDLHNISKAIEERFNVDLASRISLEIFAKKMNHIIKSVWMYERNDGSILTGNVLSRLRDIHKQGYKEGATQDFWEYAELIIYWGKMESIRNPKNFEEVIEGISKEPILDTEYVINQIIFDAMCSGRFLTI